MHYLDTSLLVPLVAREPRTDDVVTWLLTTDRALVTSEWAVTELASALSIKQRRNELDAVGRLQSERLIARLVDEALDVVPVTTSDFRQAAEFVRAPDRVLRGADALHIAVAARLGATVQSLDGPQVAAAQSLGVAAVVPVGLRSGS